MLDLRAGDWMQAFVFLVGGLMFILTMKSEIKLLAKDIKMQSKQLEAQAEELTQLATIVKDQAVMHERMNAFDRQLNDLRRGKGWIQHTTRETVNGEY